ncbi:carboxyl transferase domain-containing protein [uncultured Phenylobacterium sp.]|uniref:carboxyl transferase domain-containing protein n=1 Tax=uncultured Phenylobacterium sp. TaxID=349273 RepID=UPI0025CED030|nr:carboxyl transferase domain-containing protein [uncultured Phenylobacterium sp.]
MHKILIANRGEIAVRVARAAADLGIATVAVHPADDSGSLHVVSADEAILLPGAGARAYLDIAAIVEAAKLAGCDAVHPGYGFLSENAAFARACGDAGLVFIGPSPETLELFGDKSRARELARRHDVALLLGSEGPVLLEEARAFFAANGPLMIKAIAGGGGRGMRAVMEVGELDQAYARCRSEAQAAFGSADVYVECFMPRARHIEIQVLGDGDHVIALGERECSLQRRNQKIVELAPSPFISADLRSRLIADALKLATAARYKGLGTFEFLVDADAPGACAFMEANARVQVEHTVTEAVTGVDLVAAQIAIAGGARLADLNLDPANPPQPRGHSIQARINAETLQADGSTRSSAGTLAIFDPPSGLGIRVDAGVYTGALISPSYDSLIAKLIVHAPGDFAAAVKRLQRALSDFHVVGIANNLDLQRNIAARPEFLSGAVDPRFIERHPPELAARHPGRRELAIHGANDALPPEATAAPPGLAAMVAPMAGVLVSFEVAEGERVWVGKPIAVLEAMKMEHVVTADLAGTVQRLVATPKAALGEGAPLLFIAEGDVAPDETDEERELDLDAIRPDLAEVLARDEFLLVKNRPEAVARRRARGQLMARENIENLIDPGSLVEYGAYAIAAQRRRRSVDDLIKNTPGDGIITGFASVNGQHFSPERARTAVLAYDASVLAGTQGAYNHSKTDRLLEEAAAWRTPVVFYCEGGGGRPGDTDFPGVAGLDVPTFATFAALSGQQPLVGITAGFCFAGNAALLGCCDVIIATKDCNIGMGGPAMIEGGGLGVHSPKDVGPAAIQRKNGVIDVSVEDEVEATQVARKYLAFFQGAMPDWTAADQRRLRHVIPENRLRIYDMREVIDLLADTGSALELRHDFGKPVITALARIEGRPFGLLANDPKHLSGAIDADAADKAARFMRLCEAHGLPILSLVDTPGFMVGLEVEARAQVRHVCRMMLAGASLTVPFVSVTIRKGYGLGAQGMTAGGYHSPLFNFSWPSGEFGGMGLEGAVKLGYKKELDAFTDLAERDAYYQRAVAQSYARGKAINMATHLEIDGVIDPAETRRIVAATFAALPTRRPGTSVRRYIDAW